MSPTLGLTITKSSKELASLCNLKFDSSRDQRDFYLFIYLFLFSGEFLPPGDKKKGKASATDTKAFFFFFFLFGKRMGRSRHIMTKKFRNDHI